jgi:hypothetical protein
LHPYIVYRNPEDDPIRCALEEAARRLKAEGKPLVLTNSDDVKSMTSSQRGWIPLVDGVYKINLTVPFNGLKMDPPTYKLLLEDLLREAVERAVEEDGVRGAKAILEMSEESSPNLAQIARTGLPREWPVQIMMCDQMQTVLGQINCQRGKIVSLDPNEKPDLRGILELL